MSARYWAGLLCWIGIALWAMVLLVINMRARAALVQALSSERSDTAYWRGKYEAEHQRLVDRISDSPAQWEGKYEAEHRRLVERTLLVSTLQARLDDLTSAESLIRSLNRRSRLVNPADHLRREPSGQAQ